jgi:hypothetical protein
MGRLDHGTAFLRRLLIVLVFAVPAGEGCSHADSSPEVVAPGAEFALAPGEAAKLPDDSLHVTFEKVKDDSRCPQGVQCAWEGDAVAVISTGQNSYDLHVNPRSVRSATVGGHVVRLIGLQPQPRSGSQIDPHAYRAILRIDTA